MNPLELPELRKQILFWILKERRDLEKWMAQMMIEAIEDRWHHHCKCQSCRIKKHLEFMLDVEMY